MSADAFQRAMEVFRSVHDQPPGPRTECLDRLCAGDESLRREVRSLLDHHGDQLGLLGEHDLVGGVNRVMAGATEQAAVPSVSVPAWIGHYRILRVVGEGGMGTVYEAEQENPRRVVALKVIRPGGISRQLLRRFEIEAQALGQLHHPGIAQIYEAGMAVPTHGPGMGGTPQPFFAMELIRGRPMTQFAEDRALSPRARLELFAGVCDAVQHAHQHGIIHRDLKPANILVTDDGAPKIVDFGVARATNSDTQRTTLQTNLGQIIGTLPYMSPEQIDGDPAAIDARSDVYSLGVILYELLSRKLPVDVTDRSIPEAARMIKDDEPSRLSSINTSFRGDIETIVSKALQKDRTRRYQSAGAMASDLRRYLCDEPIQARPTSTFYQMRKFAKRNKVLVGGIGATILALAAGLAGTLRFAAGEKNQRLAAEQARDDALWETYRARIAVAADALERHDIATARKNLQEAPEELRGWEWRHFADRLDESLVQIRLEPGLAKSVSFSDDGGAVVVPRTGPEAVTARWVAATGERLPDDRSETAALARGPFLPVGPEGKLAGDVLIPRRTDHVQVVHYTLSDLGIAPGSSIYQQLLSDDTRVYAGLLQDSNSIDLRLFTMSLADSGALPRVVTGPWSADPVNGLYLRLSRDGRLMLSTHETEKVTRIWTTNPAPGGVPAPLVTLTGHTDVVTAGCFTADERVITSSWDGTIRLWEARTGTGLAVGQGHEAYVTALALAADDSVAASGALDGSIRLWNARTLEPLAVLVGNEREIINLAFAPEGQRLASVSADGWLRVWDATTRGEPNVLRGHESYVYAVDFSPDGARLASGSWDHTVRVWDTHTRRLLLNLIGHAKNVNRVSFNADGSRLASASYEGEVRLWEMPGGALRNGLDDQRIASWLVSPLGAGERVMLDLPAGSGVRVWDATDGAITDHPLSALREARAGNISGNRQFAFLSRPDGPHVVDLTTGKDVADLPKDQAMLAISPDGGHMVLRRPDLLTMVVWDVHQGREVAQLRSHSAEVLCAIFSPDGARIATGGRDQTIRLWDTATSKEVGQLRGHASYIIALAFNPEGSILASASGDHIVRLWEAPPFPHPR